MNRYICIHGHFYQPPRENPWLEAVELQDSAYPYHDWNHRITAECYATNATSRILNQKNQILKIVNNYSRISFNFGPTLLTWLEHEAPDVYNAILTADVESQQFFSGHGSAMAQPYNHMILPLANPADKYTQIYWGIQDFAHRFNRKPEGMWLPETAVDLESLDMMAELGIRFTILAPHQAARIKPSDKDIWSDAAPDTIDTTIVYNALLPSGRTISIFFYDAEISHAVAFKGLMQDGKKFAQTLMNGFADETSSGLVHIATDGETYGHHYQGGDKGLAFALNFIESQESISLTNYGEFLEKHPPAYDVQLLENSSWSCPHGIERWKSDCGCCTGAHPDWNQSWRAPLRASLNWLRDQLSPPYMEKAQQLLKNPVTARNDYIQILLNRCPRSKDTLEAFLSRHAVRKLEPPEINTVLKLMELQRNAMLMFTSCGWFFDEISGIETVQIIQYAGRAIQIYKELFGNSIETNFLTKLEDAMSNLPEHGNGRLIYEKFVIPSMVDLKKVGAHYAMSSIFEQYADQASIFCYTADREDYQIHTIGRSKLLTGRIRMTSNITNESARLSFAVLHLGEQTLTCGSHEFQSDENYNSMKETISQPFSKADFPKTFQLLYHYFGTSIYSLQTIFRDEQRKILDQIMQPALDEAQNAFQQIYENNATMLRFLKNINIPIPDSLFKSAEFYLNFHLLKAFQNENFEAYKIKSHLDEAGMIGVPLDFPTLEYALRQSLELIADSFFKQPLDFSALEKQESAVNLLKILPFDIHLRKVQTIFNTIMTDTYPEIKNKAQQGDEEAARWVEHFITMGRNLSFYIEE